MEERWLRGRNDVSQRYFPRSILSPSSLTYLNGLFYFSANNGISGEELWTSDGTAAGKLNGAFIASASGGSQPSDFTFGSKSFHGGDVLISTRVNCSCSQPSYTSTWQELAHVPRPFARTVARLKSLMMRQVLQTGLPRTRVSAVHYIERYHWSRHSNHRLHIWWLLSFAGRHVNFRFERC